LYPFTVSCSKQLMMIYDKPLFYYPLSLLILAGVTEILIISDRETTSLIRQHYGNGKLIGTSISYEVQNTPKGIPDAYVIAEDFLSGADSILMLGDNIMFGHDLSGMIYGSKPNTILLKQVSNASDFGVAELDRHDTVIGLQEKPEQPKTDLAVTGIYYLDSQAVEISKQLKPSARGELEIIDVLKHYSENKNLKAVRLGRGYSWFDCGKPSSSISASNYVASHQQNQGTMLGSPEEAAWRAGLIGSEKFQSLINRMPTCEYKHLLQRQIMG
jgi:glucose-1-phosphate thymidylyltransferase